ncbi:kelch domain-containing protein 1-like [Archocentrus centrarchus]|uniref:kelch domain-containing protein 1-like n=1 Tax=Archocentrus centrarchus TaxID=63155 RepID=UPI0011EA3820|nr:kelch domain-containing protein 1-like [Archocentrus centrarchus]
MDAAQGGAPLSPAERSSHTAFIENNTLYVWGGYQVVAGLDIVLPSDEIWLCDLDSGMWEQMEMTGDIPPHLSSFCGANINTKLYIFGGYEEAGYSNQMFSVDLTEPRCTWKRVTDTKGTTPSPRNKHSCWVHRDRLIYFGGYGCKTLRELQNTSSSSFVLEEMSWSRAVNEVTLCKGWNSEVNVFDTLTATWSMPETQGCAPSPRGCHASALLGNKGYISGGVEATELDMFCLDLETWTWTKFDITPHFAPLGRSWHTTTATSDGTLFMYGGFSTNGETLNDAWQFNPQTSEWTKLTHPHKDKPRVFHTACLGRDSDVVVFGGSRSLCIIMDSMAILRLPSPHHCKDILIFQTQPYSLSRLCEDLIGRNSELFRMQLSCLPSKLQRKLEKRMTFFSAGS